MRICLLLISYRTIEEIGQKNLELTEQFEGIRYRITLDNQAKNDCFNCLDIWSLVLSG